ncbi:MAG: hypothetical protein PHC88_05350 [Terrimicrobiaceae bacterium]|nr:hypothetical protein [Terrimicrobiaceae bacterium]
MDPVQLHLDGDGCWPDLNTKPFDHGVLHEVAYLQRGMSSGNPSVSMRITLDDGRIVIAETSARMFVTLAAGIKGKGLHDGIDI